MNALDRLRDDSAVARLWARDGSLFSSDPAVAADAGGWLGWVGLADRASRWAEALSDASAAVVSLGITDVVLLGMGGSSLAPLVLSSVIGSGPGYPSLHVLDTTSPYTVLRTLERLTPRTTLVVVSSKSGGTIEPNSLYAVLCEWAETELGTGAGSHFVAITDPGSSLEALADEQGFAAVFHGEPDVGGRFSALTAFGLVPASLIGIDIARLARSAMDIESAVREPGSDNPAAKLAAWMVDALEAGRDKLTFVASKDLAPFGLWVEQLVAESTGKDGTGLVPVLDDAPGDGEAYGEDRMVLIMRGPGDETLASLAGRLPAGTPVFEVVVDDPHDVAGEFVRWEHAVALAGHLMGIHPFDQPAVGGAKEATTAILAGTLAAPEPTLHVGGIRVTCVVPGREASEFSSLASALDGLLDGAGPGDYLALLAYLPEERSLLGPLAGGLAAVSAARRLACCLEIGPRYLHSTGQLHKAGPAVGRFLMVTTRNEPVIHVPGRAFTLEELIRAQAEGDFVTLAERGLRIVRVDLPEPAHAPVMLLAETLRGAAIG